MKKMLWSCIAAIVAALLAPAGDAQAAWTSTQLLFFTPATGSNPYGGLTSDAAGNLYGTTIDCQSGQDCGGTVFKMTPPAVGKSQWTYTVLFDSVPGEGGFGLPYGNLIIDAAGNLYGTTTAGGAGNVFKLAAPPAGRTAWTLSIMSSPGGGVQGGVIFDKYGNLYGTTVDGGLRDNGMVFELTQAAVGEAQWTETILHNFANTDGANPTGGLIIDAAGNLYGTASAGGKGGSCSGGCGTVFELSPPPVGQTLWTESVLFFFGGADGSHPQGGLTFDSAGNLYGTTAQGGYKNNGEVFRLTRPTAGHTAWTISYLHFFNGPSGSQPSSNLIFDAAGNLYGATNAGGVTGSSCSVPQTSGCGVVFELTPPTGGGTPWIETELRFFAGKNGAGPFGNLTFDMAGSLYGTTTYGGPRKLCPGAGAYGCGVVYKLTP